MDDLRSQSLHASNKLLKIHHNPICFHTHNQVFTPHEACGGTQECHNDRDSQPRRKACRRSVLPAHDLDLKWGGHGDVVGDPPNIVAQTCEMMAQSCVLASKEMPHLHMHRSWVSMTVKTSRKATSQRALLRIASSCTRGPLNSPAG